METVKKKRGRKPKNCYNNTGYTITISEYFNRDNELYKLWLNRIDRTTSKFKGYYYLPDLVDVRKDILSDIFTKINPILKMEAKNWDNYLWLCVRNYLKQMIYKLKRTKQDELNRFDGNKLMYLVADYTHYNNQLNNLEDNKIKYEKSLQTFIFNFIMNEVEKRYTIQQQQLFKFYFLNNLPFSKLSKITNIPAYKIQNTVRDIINDLTFIIPHFNYLEELYHQTIYNSSIK